MPTASAPFKVKVSKTADGVTVTDYQGNVAKVVSADLGAGAHRVHAIDKVLFSGESNSGQTLVKHSPCLLLGFLQAEPAPA